MKCVLFFFALLVSLPVPSSATSSTITPQEIQTWLELCKSLRIEIEALKSSSANSKRNLQELEAITQDSERKIDSLSQRLKDSEKIIDSQSESLETSEAKTSELTMLLTEAQALSTSLRHSLDGLRRERDIERVWWVVGVIAVAIVSWGVGRWR